MRRPSIPFKPDAPSVHPLTGKLTLSEKLRALDRFETMTEAELIAELERDMHLPPGFFDPPHPAK